MEFNRKLLKSLKKTTKRMKMYSGACSLCGNSIQYAEWKTGRAYVCLMYCKDCMQCHHRGYLDKATGTIGISFLSKHRAAKKAVKLGKQAGKII